MHKVASLLAVLALLALPSMALGGSAGNALGVNPAADAAFEGQTRTLVVGSDVFIGDLIQTGPKGQVQILFADNTELVVGPSSSLTIEDYLLRNDGSPGKLVVDMLSGAFRFATGDSAKNRYQINTPTGTIGVRGTNFDVLVDGKARILLYHGIVRFCTFDGDCKEISDFCQLGEIGSAETLLLGDSRESTGDQRAEFQAQFIYAMNQQPLLREFWFARARECLNRSEGQEIEVDNGPDPKPPGRNNDFNLNFGEVPIP
jgi:hypothetical protein